MGARVELCFAALLLTAWRALPIQRRFLAREPGIDTASGSVWTLPGYVDFGWLQHDERADFHIRRRRFC